MSPRVRVHFKCVWSCSINSIESFNHQPSAEMSYVGMDVWMDLGMYGCMYGWMDMHT